MTETIKDGRSGVVGANIQEIIDASVSAKHATLGNAQQYQTPEKLAAFFNSLLPEIPDFAFDPQCAEGRTVICGLNRCNKFGFEIDRRYAGRNDGVQRVIGNCVSAYEIADDLHPDFRFPCQNANPPFGLLLKVGDGKEDSTAYTWRKILERASPQGYGWFISNYKTIERLGIHKHPWVYLYQRFPKGVWDNCDVEIGVVHWDASDNFRFSPAPHVLYVTLDLSENAEVMARIKGWYQRQEENGAYREHPTGAYVVRDAFEEINKVLEEERKSRPDFNVYLGKDGSLRTYLSTRFQIKRKIVREEILKLERINRCHPLALCVDVETRRILESFVTEGIYTVQPEARKAIADAIKENERISVPIMPVTDFETIAYADEMDSLECIRSCYLPKTGDTISLCSDVHHPTDANTGKTVKRQFTKGKRYELSSSTYSYTKEFERDKPHLDEEEGRMYTVKHRCALTRTDRYIAVTDDTGKRHRFMAEPRVEDQDHEEALLWKIFQKPVVRTVAEVNPEEVEKNKRVLLSCEMLADFTYYPGQADYLARVAVKPYGLVAAATGAGKTLMALTLIQTKAPKRALIIAPQGTVKDTEEDEDSLAAETDESPGKASAAQWFSEIRRFAPGLPAFQLFNLEDYAALKKVNGGQLPEGIYVSYWEALFQNSTDGLYGRAIEQCPPSWDDKRLAKFLGLKEPPPIPPDAKTDDSEHYWCDSIGKESNGIRCIMSPCLATLIGREFDFVALDEAHKLQNLDSITTQMAIRLQPRYRWAFSATPIPNVVSNMFPLIGWLAVEGWYKGNRRNAAFPYAREELGRFISTFQSVERDHTQEEFNAAAARAAGNHRYKGKCEKVSPVISSPARLLKVLKPTLAFISKEMCNPKYTPAKIVEIRVPMGAEQTKLYAHFMNRANIPAKNPLVRARKQITYLRNICADPMGFTHGGPPVKSNFNPKTVAILELVRDIVNRGEQAVVVCARKGQTNTLKLALEEAGVVVSRIDSTMAAEQHSAQSNMFKAKRSQIHLMGIKCAIGHSYDECPNLIVGSLEYSFGSLEQARGRVDRVNSKLPRTIYCVLHDASIESVMFSVVATKEDAATIALRGQPVPRNYKPVDMSEVLAQAMVEFKNTGMEEAVCEAQWPKLRDSFKV